MNVVFFEIEGTNKKYGLGTYAENIIDNINSFPEVKFYYVHIFSAEVDEITIKETGNLVDIYFPVIFNNSRFFITRLTASAIYCILSEVVNFSVPTVFHLNSNLQCTIGEILTEHAHHTIIYTLHVSLWKELFHNDYEKYKRTELENKNGKLLSAIVLEKKICSYSSMIICLAEDTKSFIVNDYSIDSDKVAVISNGISIPDDNLTGSINDIKKELGLSGTERIILFAGRLHPTKGIPFLIEAFKLVAADIPDVRLVIAGNEHVAYMGGFEKYFEMCKGVRGRVTFTGYLYKDELYKFYKIADMGIIPSLHEQSSYVALEMMSRGLPMIVCDIPAFRDILEHNISAIKIKTDPVQGNVPDVKDLATAIRTLLGDPLLASNLGKNTRRLVESRFSSKQMVDKLFNVYTKVAAGRENITLTEQ